MGSRVKSLFPGSVRQHIAASLRDLEHLAVRLAISAGIFGRSTPLRRAFGCHAGTPIDRYYIESFLAQNARVIRGTVLEVGDDSYTRRFGGNRVRRSDVLHVNEEDEKVTLVADLSQAEEFPAARYDCVILTQTLQFVFDVPGAIESIHRTLRPGGVSLVTAPGISQISRYDMERWGEFWRFTSRSLPRLFSEQCAWSRLEVGVHGNILATTAFLHGVVTEEMGRSRLDATDPDYELLLTLRAEK